MHLVCSLCPSHYTTDITHTHPPLMCRLYPCAGEGTVLGQDDNTALSRNVAFHEILHSVLVDLEMRRHADGQ